MVELKIQAGRQWRKVLITFLPPTLAILFTALLIFQSAILRPGGIWLEKPHMGTVIAQDHVPIRFSAYSYTLLPLDRVELLYWYEGIDQHEWKKLCVFQPRDDKIYSCNFDFVKLQAPVGQKILLSFNVYGVLTRGGEIGNILMNYKLAPDGWSCFYWQRQAVDNPCGTGYP